MSTVEAEPVTRGSPSRRSLRGFWVAAGVAVLGLAAALAWAVVAGFSAAGSPSDLARSDLPGTVTTRVSDPGRLLVYYEGDPVPDLGRLGVVVTGPSEGFVPVTAYEPVLEYDSPVTPGVVGRAVASFDASLAGTYRVDSPFIPSDGAHLAVGPDIGRGFLQTLVGPAVLATGSVLAAVLIALLTAVRINRRYRHSP